MPEKKAPAKKSAPALVDPSSAPSPPAISTDATIGPAPITPSSTPKEKERRTRFEDMVNAGAREFAAQAHDLYISTVLAGGTVEIVTHLPE